MVFTCPYNKLTAHTTTIHTTLLDYEVCVWQWLLDVWTNECLQACIILLLHTDWLCTFTCFPKWHPGTYLPPCLEDKWQRSDVPQSKLHACMPSLTLSMMIIYIACRKKWIMNWMESLILPFWSLSGLLPLHAPPAWKGRVDEEAAQHGRIIESIIGTTIRLIMITVVCIGKIIRKTNSSEPEGGFQGTLSESPKTPGNGSENTNLFPAKGRVFRL